MSKILSRAMLAMLFVFAMVTLAWGDWIFLSQLERLERSEAVLIDVREVNEYEASHIPGAVNIPLGVLKYRDLTPILDKEIILMCRTHNRSKKALGILKAIYGENLNAKVLFMGMEGFQDRQGE